MAGISEHLTGIVSELFEIGAVKFGNFKMKSGSYSPIYFDMRLIISYPDLLSKISHLLVEILSCIPCEIICGVPYTALPIATAMSVECKVPSLIRRKEMKQYGTKKLIEGKFNRNDRCVIIEDVITSGSSILETAKDLEEEGLIVTDAIVIMDRAQGGVAALDSHNIMVHSLFSILPFVDYLVDQGKIEYSMFSRVEEYLKNSQIVIKKPPPDRLRMTFEQRSEHSKNEVAKKLFAIMLRKKTNLCVAADLTDSHSVLKLFDQVGPYICMLKTHVDILTDVDDEFYKKLLELAEKHDVVLVEDRKYADIGNTVHLQSKTTSTWADAVTVHVLPGPGVLAGVKKSFGERLNGVFIIAEMSSEDNLITNTYVRGAVEMAERDLDSVTGFVCQTKDVITDPGLIQLTPGVKFIPGSDGFDQTYLSPAMVVRENGADVAIVGRGIVLASDPAEEARKYRNVLWTYYESRIRSRTITYSHES